MALVRRPMGQEYVPSPSSPYFQFGIQRRRFPFMWNAGQGGIVNSARAGGAPPSSLGMADMLESGYGDSNFLPYPPLQNSIAHHCGARRTNEPGQLAGIVEYGPILGTIGIDMIKTQPPPPPPPKPPPRMLRATASRQMIRGGSLGDWPLVRQSGPEPVDPNEGVPFTTMALGSIANLSDNEKIVAVAGLALGGYLLYKRHKKKRRRR